MCTVVTIEQLSDLVSQAAEGEQGLLALRCLVNDFYAAEVDIQAESEDTERALAVLASYLEYDEAFGDLHRHLRLRRLRAVMNCGKYSPEHVAFAIEFDELNVLESKLHRGVISGKVFSDQVQKLSPISLDWEQVICWTHKHFKKQKDCIDVSLLT